MNYERASLLIDDSGNLVAYKSDDPSETFPVGGGAGILLKRAHFLATLLNIPTGEWVNPPSWIYDPSVEIHSDEILDVTDPTAPTAIEAGEYTVNVELQLANPDELEAGKSMYVELDLDLNGENPNVATNQSLDPANAPPGFGVQAALSLSYYVPVGGVINVAVQHNLTNDMETALISAWVTFKPVTVTD